MTCPHAVRTLLICRLLFCLYLTWRTKWWRWWWFTVLNAVVKLCLRQTKALRPALVVTTINPVRMERVLSICSASYASPTRSLSVNCWSVYRSFIQSPTRPSALNTSALGSAALASGNAWRKWRKRSTKSPRFYRPVVGLCLRVFLDQELIAYRCTSCSSCCSLLGAALQKS